MVAIFKAENDAEVLAEAMSQASLVVVPATCLVEAALLRQIGRGFFDWIEETMKDPRFEVGEISAQIAQIATKTARTYGKGSGHPAQLNFGDCLSYAVAEFRGLPLLFTGTDFAQTPIEPVVATKRT